MREVESFVPHGIGFGTGPGQRGGAGVEFEEDDMRAGRQETGFMTAPSGRRDPDRGAGPGRVQCPRGASRARAMGRRARSPRGTFSSRARRARAQIDVDFCIRRRPHRALGSLAERRGAVVNPVPSERTAPFGSPVEASSLEAGKSAGCGRRDNGVVGRASELDVAGCEDELACVPRDWLPSDRARGVQPTYLHPPRASWVVQVPFGQLSLISSAPPNRADPMAGRLPGTMQGPAWPDPVSHERGQTAQEVLPAQC